jgi:hypothetical protein
MSRYLVPPQLGSVPGLRSASSSIFDLPVSNKEDSVQSAIRTSSNCRNADTSEDYTHSEPQSSKSEPKVLVISGGSGCNDICGAFGQDTCYVLPVSDDGGSSSEIIRVLGGPSIGISGTFL